MEAIFVKVILNQNPANYTLLKVLSTVSLSQMENYFVNSNHQKSRRGSLEVKATEAIDKAITQVEITFSFTKELQGIYTTVTHLAASDEAPENPDRFLPPYFFCFFNFLISK